MAESDVTWPPQEYDTGWTEQSGTHDAPEPGPADAQLEDPETPPATPDDFPDDDPA